MSPLGKNFINNEREFKFLLKRSWKETIYFLLLEVSKKILLPNR